MKGERAKRRLKEVARMSAAEQAAYAGVSLAKWSVLQRAQRRELLARAVHEEK
jgi:hypothetical protein